MKYRKIKSSDHTYYIRESVFVAIFGDEKNFFAADKMARMGAAAVIIGEFNTIVKCRFDMEKIFDTHTKDQS